MNSNNTSHGNDNITDIIPKTVDQIITKNRDLCTLHIAAQNDFDQIPALVDLPESQMNVTGTLSDWYLICMKKPEKLGGNTYFLIGINEEYRCVWNTSEVLRFDLANGFALTKSGSIYKLEQQGIGEPAADFLLHICATLHKWGSGVFLGVLYVFY